MANHHSVGEPSEVIARAHESTVQPCSPRLGASQKNEVGRPCTSQLHGFDM